MALLDKVRLFANISLSNEQKALTWLEIATYVEYNPHLRVLLKDYVKWISADSFKEEQEMFLFQALDLYGSVVAHPQSHLLLDRYLWEYFEHIPYTNFLKRISDICVWRYKNAQQQQRAQQIQRFSQDDRLFKYALDFNKQWLFVVWDNVMTEMDNTAPDIVQFAGYFLRFMFRCKQFDNETLYEQLERFVNRMDGDTQLVIDAITSEEQLEHIRQNISNPDVRRMAMLRLRSLKRKEGEPPLKRTNEPIF
jgi:hypothetical protein